MNMNEYQEEARRTQRTDLPLWALREHALFGLSSEGGEVLGLHQKVHQGHPMDEAALRLEIGDVLWFVAELCDCYGWSMDDIAAANIQKLRVRYKDKFTAEESVKRRDTKPKKQPVRSKYLCKGGETMKRQNRLWLPENRGIQATMCMCERCCEAYEAGLEHVCGMINSYPVKEVMGVV